uniref:Uncharacterized protein n=1 Tax=Aureimonas altamirensis TaxID=370622 RepID=A0A0P0YWJ7_9HYPH|nr:hypothetical protein [Aureimonas altamirensis]
MIGLLLAQVGNEVQQRIAEHGALSVALPVDVTGNALGRELAIRDFGQGAEMDVGKMGESKHQRQCKPAAGFGKSREVTGA